MDDYEQLVRRNARTKKVLTFGLWALTLLGGVTVLSAWWYIFVREDPAYAACVDRGVKYFMEIGSYPRLKAYPEAGRLAEDVARERCRRSLLAFPE